MIYDDLERQQEVYLRAKVSALAARLESLPPDGSRGDWQNQLQREEPLLARLGIYDRRNLVDSAPAEDGGDTPAHRAVVPFQNARGAAYAEFELAQGEPEALVAGARTASMVSAMGGILVFLLALFGAWGAGRLKTEGRLEAESEQQSRFEAMSMALAKEFEAAAGAMKAIPAPESTELVPYETGRLDRLASELGLLATSATPSYTNVDSRVLVDWVSQRAEGVKIASGSPAIRFASDANLLGEAMLRLVRNAAEANPEGEVQVEFLRPTGSAVTIQVLDTGPGLRPEAVPRLYDPFFTTKTPAGLGLGLTVARKLVTALGGSLAVESKPEGGTAAEIRLENISTSPV